MAKITFPNMEAYERQLERIGSEAPKLCGKALYQGARVLAEAVQAEIDGLTELSPSQLTWAWRSVALMRASVRTTVGSERLVATLSKASCSWSIGQPPLTKRVIDLKNTPGRSEYLASSGPKSPASGAWALAAA